MKKIVPSLISLTSTRLYVLLLAHGKNLARPISHSLLLAHGVTSRSTSTTELNSSRTVLDSTVTQMCEIFACDSAYLDVPLAEISYNSAVYNDSYTQKIRGSANYGTSCICQMPDKCL